MSEDHPFPQNLRAARKAKGWTLDTLAAEAETSKGYLSELERGRRPTPPGAFLDKLATALGTTAATLAGESTAVLIPVISTVAAGQLADPETQITGDFPTITLSGLEPGDYFATEVEGTSMNRISPPGSTIIVNRRETELIRGRRYIFSRRGKTTYKKYETNPARLEPETTDPEANPTIFPRSDDEWIVIGRVRVTLLRDI